MKTRRQLQAQGYAEGYLIYWSGWLATELPTGGHPAKERFDGFKGWVRDFEGFCVFLRHVQWRAPIVLAVEAHWFYSPGAPIVRASDAPAPDKE